MSEHKDQSDGEGGSGDRDQYDPADDPQACSRCGTYIGLGVDYCEGCAREIGVKRPMQRCMGCGRDGPEEQMEPIDVSTPDEYYPKMAYLCGSCSGGESDAG